MDTDQFGSGTLIFLLGVACFGIGTFYIRKERFLTTDDFKGFKHTLFLPPVVNFWLLKLFLMTSGLVFIFVGIYLIIVGLF
ncbi:MAG: hypothetical protein H9W80_12875 [Enterococcus sp.]|nr:hypothetical protein [Enterococcus sp.]